MRKKHVTHIKKIEYTPSDGFLFIKRSTHEFLKTRSIVSINDIRANSIVESDFVGGRFICTDNEEVRAFLEFYERKKEGVERHVFLKRDFKDFVEIPKDEYDHDLMLFSIAMLGKNGQLINKPITDNTVDEKINREFEATQKEIDALIHKVDNYSVNVGYYSIDDLWQPAI